MSVWRKLWRALSEAGAPNPGWRDQDTWQGQSLQRAPQPRAAPPKSYSSPLCEACNYNAAGSNVSSRLCEICGPIKSADGRILIELVSQSIEIVNGSGNILTKVGRIRFSLDKLEALRPYERWGMTRGASIDWEISRMRETAETLIADYIAEQVTQARTVASNAKTERGIAQGYARALASLEKVKAEGLESELMTGAIADLEAERDQRLKS